jgi:quercetin dioxygenase-like cupin family protein
MPAVIAVLHQKETLMARAVTLIVVLCAVVLVQGTPVHTQSKANTLLTQELTDLENKEVLMLTVEYGPGQSSAPHRHNAHTFVYVLEGAVVMGVQGKEPVKLEPGQTFYESPDDVHAVARNASDTRSAKILVTMIKEKGAPATVPVK